MRQNVFLFLLFAFVLSTPAVAQRHGGKPLRGQVETTPGDSTKAPALEETEVPLMTQVGSTDYKGRVIPPIILPTLPKYPPMEFKNEKERERYNRLVYNVKKVLPWAKLTKMTIIETYQILRTLPDQKAREAHLRDVEKGLRKQYAPALKKLTRSQGQLLVKLINRECNQTGYSIAKAFMGGFKANLYQGVALLFGNSLTKKYDPEGDDRYTERVVQMVEAGLL